MAGNRGGRRRWWLGLAGVFVGWGVGGAGAAELLHRYSFTAGAGDTIGTAHGTLMGGATISGGAVVLNGAGAYVDLPNGLLSARDDLTLETWLTDNNSGTWARIFDFGNSTAGEGNAGTGTQYLFLTPQGGAGALRGAITISGSGGGEQLLEWPGTRLPNAVLTHVVWTYDSAAQTGRLYVDGVLVSENTSMSVRPSDMGTTLNNWLGRSQFSADPFLNGAITEFRIYGSALTAAEVEQNCEFGPDALAFSGPVAVISHPASQAVNELSPATFGVAYSGNPPIGVQWYRGASPIAGATNDTYTIASAALADDHAVFHAVLSNTVEGAPHTAVTSNAVLTVLADTTPPVLVRAASAYPDGVRVMFSEGVSDVTATQPANYAITYAGGSLAVTAAAFDGSTSNILLATGPQVLNTLYTLTVNNLRDRSSAANPIAANSQATFVAVPYLTDDVGAPAVISTLDPASGGFDFTAAGAGLGGATDQFGFAHQVYSGDFDIQVRLAGLAFSGPWARAGLMARDGLDADARFAGSFAAAGPAGCQFAARTAVGGEPVGQGFFPATPPDLWLRLRRIGNVFEGFAGLDGQTWQRLGSATIAMPSTAEVGFAVMSGEPDQATAAQFRDPSTGGGTILNSLALPFEPMGPSTRRTALVISEIMYDTPGAWGGVGNLEFVELWNSGLITEDLTGHRLDGEITYTFPDATRLAPGEFLVVAGDPAAAQAFYGVDCLGPFTNKLANEGGELRLYNELGGILLEVEFSNRAPWPMAAAGTGHSLVLSRPSYGENDPRAWSASDVIGGSPGTVDPYGSEPARGIVINEFLAHTADAQADYVELFNPGPGPVDLSGAWLSDHAGETRFQVPAGSVVAAGGFLVFDQDQLGFALAAEGEEIILVNAARTRVLDAVNFLGQANGVASGRHPDGAPGFRELSAPSPGAVNPAPLARPVVINEVMYHPISGSEDDEYLELYNRDSTPVDLSGWQIQDGVRFHFPPGTVIVGNGYLVVARNADHLVARYPQLNSTNTRGNYDGALANGGERIALAMPECLVSTNTLGGTITNVFHVVVDEVTYRDGGRWGQWSDGGGSSLELVDPDADNRLAANWADSDESAKAPWTSIDVTAPLVNGQSAATVDEGGYYGQPNRFELFTQGAGEVLVDDLEFRNNGGNNLLGNGDFSSGTAGWTLGGVVRNSVAESGALRLVATARGDTGPNKASHALATTAATGGPNTGTVRARARWLKGSPYLMLRLRGNWMEVSQRLEVPATCGTPGLANSRRLANAGPAIRDVTHTPILPGSGEAVVVSARVDDPDGIGTVTLRYRLDPDTSYSIVTMRDNGAGGDAVAGDGRYAATLPGQPTGTLAAFHVAATDGLAAAARFPAAAAGRECLVRWGEAPLPGGLGTYRMWLTASNITFWANREINANDPIDATFVYGNHRVIYNIDTMYSGSPFHAPAYNGPTGSFPCDYEANFPPDDRLLGSEPFVVTAEDMSGGFWFDPSVQVDLTGTWIGRKLGQQYNYRRHVHMLVNGLRRGTIYQDTQQPNSEMLDEYFPDDTQEELRKIESWFEFTDDGQTQGSTWARIARVDAPDGSIDAKWYRWNFRPRATRHPNNWFAFTNLVAAVNDIGAADYEGRVRTWMDVRNFLRPVAVHHICGSWDTYAYDRGKNMYAFKPDGQGWRLLMWDIEIALGAGNGPTDSIYRTTDPVLFNLITSVPAFHREYLQAFQEAVDTALAPGVADVILDERYANLRANGVPIGSPQFIKNFISARRSYLQGVLPTAAFSVNGAASFPVSENGVVLTGSAPLQVFDILVNGIAYPVEWTDTTAWRLTVPLGAGANVLAITGVDRFGNPVTGASASRTVTYTGEDVDPDGWVVINEIHPSAEAGDRQFVEIYNRHFEYTFDLSGWRVNGLGYPFPVGSLLGPGQYRLLVQDPFAFSAANPFAVIDGVYGGNLDPDGETLTLFRPGDPPGEEIVVDRVRYEAAAPWPDAPSGSSLQLVDAARDNSRVANWAAATNAPASGPQTVIEIDHTWKYSQSGDLGTAWRAPAYNDAAWPTGAALLYVENSPLPAPTNTELTIGQRTYYFRTAFSYAGNVAGATLNLSTVVDDGVVLYLNGQEIHRLGMGPGSVTYDTLASRTVYEAEYEGPFSLGATALVPGQNVLAAEVHQVTAGSSDIVFGMTLEVMPGPATAATPGTANSVTRPLPAFPEVWLNELQAENLAGPQDNFGERDPWIDFFYAGAAPLSLDGYFLTADYNQPTQWAFPAGASIPAGGFLRVWCDGQTGQTTADHLHAGCVLVPGSGHVALTRLLDDQPQVVDYLNYQGLPANWSYGDVPDGQPFYRRTMFYATPAAANNGASAPVTVFVNEWLADNEAVLSDPADGDYEDWFELYNPGPDTADLGGYFLTDDPTDPHKFEIPADGNYVIPPGGFLLVWADNEPEQNSTDCPDLHVNFALGKGGDALGLFGADGSPVDSVSFGAQLTNVSEGRFPDGAAAIHSMPMPTPRAANVLPLANTAPALEPIADRVLILGQTLSLVAVASDNDLPAQTLTFSLDPALPGAAIHPFSGLLTYTPDAAPSMSTLGVVVTDNGSPPLSASRSFIVTVVPAPALDVIDLDPVGISFSWPSVSGQAYQVCYKDDLREPQWIPLGGLLIGAGNPLSFTNHFGEANSRYFIIVLPP